MNSALQCLFTFPKLREAVAAPQETDKKVKGYNANVTEQLRVLFNDMKNAAEKEEKSLSPKNFVDAFQTRHMNDFPLRRQQDAGELLTRLLEDVPSLGENGPFAGTITKKTWAEHDPNIKLDDKSEPLVSLEVPLGSSDRLEDLLRNMAKEETMEGDNAVTFDGVKHTAKQRYSYKFGPILQIQLKRFGYAGLAKKITSPIKVPEKLIFGKDGIDIGEMEGTYRLKGAVLHHGSTPNSGHYTAVVKYNGQWYLCDDTHVKEIGNNFEKAKKTDSSFDKKAYLLFYEKEG